jgi:hypothetical protein
MRDDYKGHQTFMKTEKIPSKPWRAQMQEISFYSLPNLVEHLSKEAQTS